MKSNLAVKGRKGDALLFRNADDRGRPDPNFSTPETQLKRVKNSSPAAGSGSGP